MKNLAINDKEFSLFRKMIYETAGINMSDAKKALVSGRLAKRVKKLGLETYSEYYDYIKKEKNGEFQTAVDLLTTNETYFFREPKHFNFLRDTVIPSWEKGERRIWSAACSSGEEVYTLAMVMQEYSKNENWQIVGSDLSTRVLERAKSAHYPLERAKNIPEEFLRKYCLKGVGSQDGTLLIDKSLRSRVSFLHKNLKHDVSKMGSFDLIILRNVLIYFDHNTKANIVANLLPQLKPGGYFIVGHSESLNGVNNQVEVIAPSIYRKS